MAIKLRPDMPADMQPTAPEGPPEPRFRAPPEAPYKAADEQPDTPEPLADPGEWNTDMDQAPRDGAIVDLLFAHEFADGKGRSIYATWRTTRRKVPGRWALVSFWADPISREEIPGMPIAWRRPEGYAVLPGMLRGKA